MQVFFYIVLSFIVNLFQLLLPITLLVVIDIFIARTLIKKGNGKKITKKVPIYATLLSIVLIFLLFLYLVLISRPRGEDTLIFIVFPYLLAISLTIVPLISYIVALIYYKKSFKNLNKN